MSLTPFKFPFVAFELAVAVFAGRFAYVHLNEPAVAFSFFALMGMAMACAWIILADNWPGPRKPRPPYGGVA